MTFKEATTIAMREIGIKEEEIEKRLTFASRNTIAFPGIENSDIIEGKERETIESIKKLYQYAATHEEEVRDTVRILDEKMGKLTQLN